MRQAKSRTVRRTGLILGGLLLATSGLLPATDEPLTLPMTGAAKIADEVDLTIEDGQVLLPLDQAITLALERNIALVVQRYRHEATRLGIREAVGIYDFNIQTDLVGNSDKRPTNSLLEDAEIYETDYYQANFTLSQLTSFGGTAQLAFTNNQFETSNLYVQPNPQMSLGLDLTYFQPLLRDFGRLTTERNLVVARINRSISREDFQLQVEAVIEAVANAYWDLVEFREQLAVAEESLELAQELHEMNRIQVEVGTLAPLEMVQSEAGVAARQEDIIRLRAQVEDAADNLRRLMNLKHGELWDYPLAPVTEPETPYVAIDLGQAVASAMKNRLDVRRLRLVNEIRRIDAKMAHNQKQPRLDARVTYGYNALSGDLTIFDPVTGQPVGVIEEGYGDALDQLAERDFDGWTVAVTFAYPLQNRTARARSATADLLVEQGTSELEDLEQQVLTGVRRTARAVETAAQRIESAKVSSRLAQRNLEAERKRYDNGLSTSFQVLEIQENLSQERSREVSAIVSYRRALVAYHRAIGRLLEEARVVLADDE